MRFHAVAVLCALSCIASTAAFSAEIKVLSTEAMRAVMEELAPQFEGTANHKVELWFGTVGAVVKRVQDGERADMIVAPRQGVDTLSKENRLVDASIAPIALSRLGVAVKAGASRPDISSPEAFKRALLLAKSITYVPPAMGGASGPHIVSVFERLGIADEMKKKTIAPDKPGGAAVSDLVADGRAELALHQIQDFTGRAGVEVVGPFPTELQSTVTFAAAIFRGGNADAADALIEYLRSPQAVAVIRSKGMDAP